MKNRKTLAGLFVILALLCLGIGYAAISKTLTINGGVATGDEESLKSNFVVYFSNVDVIAKPDGVAVDASVDKDAKTLETTFDITNMSGYGSEVKLEYTITNDSPDLYANFAGYAVSLNLSNGNELPVTGKYDDETKYTYYEVGEFGIYIKRVDPIAGYYEHIEFNGGTAKIEVIVKLMETPLQPTECDFKIKINYSGSDLFATS